MSCASQTAHPSSQRCSTRDPDWPLVCACKSLVTDGNKLGVAPGVPWKIEHKLVYYLFPRPYVDLQGATLDAVLKEAQWQRHSLCGRQQGEHFSVRDGYAGWDWLVSDRLNQGGRTPQSRNRARVGISDYLEVLAGGGHSMIRRAARSVWKRMRLLYHASRTALGADGVGEAALMTALNAPSADALTRMLRGRELRFFFDAREKGSWRSGSSRSIPRR